MPFVKICGLKDARTAQAAQDAGADALGLVFAPSRRQVSVKQAQEMVQRVKARWVAVVKDILEADLTALMEAVPLWAVQFHGLAPYDWITLVQAHGLIAIDTKWPTTADIALLDGPDPGSGQERDWTRPQGDRPVWIAGGLSPDNVGTVVQRLHPDGVDVSSGVEIDGVKDIHLIQQFIKEAKSCQK
ncbi:MAG: phosphoribosylanthranilate isomerase [Firmicutes bacterium]|nr:phosphoribosylanthranilate isomerase [Bacillota bacterium]